VETVSFDSGRIADVWETISESSRKRAQVKSGQWHSQRNLELTDIAPRSIVSPHVLLRKSHLAEGAKAPGASYSLCLVDRDLVLRDAGIGAGPADEITGRPLAPRSCTTREDMFVELSPQQTGLVTTNDYADPRCGGNSRANSKADRSARRGHRRLRRRRPPGHLCCQQNRKAAGSSEISATSSFEDVTEKAGVGITGRTR